MSDIVRFSGHGANAGLAFQDDEDELRLLSNKELAVLLKACPSPIKLVVFNSCNSSEQARVAIEHAPAAVGMSQSIEDEAARVFAGQLYNALGFAPFARTGLRAGRCPSAAHTRQALRPSGAVRRGRCRAEQLLRGGSSGLTAPLRSLIPPP
jgi:hypothetical protein